MTESEEIDLRKFCLSNALAIRRDQEPAADQVVEDAKKFLAFALGGVAQSQRTS